MKKFEWMTPDMEQDELISFFLCFQLYRAHYGHLEKIGQLIHDICIYIQWGYEFKAFLY